MQLDLTPETERLIARTVASGRYASASEMVQMAVHRLTEEDELTDIQRDHIRRMIDEGLDDVREGRTVDGETFFQELFAKRAGPANSGE